MPPDKRAFPAAGVGLKAIDRGKCQSIPPVWKRQLPWIAALILLGACTPRLSAIPRLTVVVSIQTISSLQDAQTLQPVSAPDSSAQWMGYTNGNNLSALLVDQAGRLWSAGNGGIVQWDTPHGAYRKYTAAEGLPANDIAALAQSMDGKLWAGARNGYAAFFDGGRWQLHPELVGETITAMAAAPDGSLWFGTNRGMVRYDGRNWSAYIAQNGLSGGEVNALLVDRAGRVWAAMTGGLASFEQGGWHAYAFPTGTRFTSLAQTTDGSLWAGSEGRLYRSSGAGWQEIDFRQDPDHARVGRIAALAAAPGGALWLSTPGYLVEYDGQNWTAFRSGEDQPLASLAVDPNGGLWAGGTATGLLHIAGNDWRGYRSADGLGSNFILSLAVGPGGDVWAGTNQGAFHHTDQAWQLFSSANGLADDPVLAVATAPDGSTWFGTQSGAARYLGGGWITYTPENGYDMGQVAQIAATGNGSLWFAAQRGAWLYDVHSDTLYPVQGELPDSRVQDVAAGPDGSAWFLTPKGIVRFAESRWLPVNFPDQEFITCLAEAASGDLWLGTRLHGVYRLSGEIWSQFSIGQADQLNLNPDGSAYYQNGTDLLPLNGKFLQHYRQADGLPDDTVNALAIAPNEVVWAGTDHGAGRFADGSWQSFGLGSGLGEQKVQAVAVAPDGAIWFGSTLGGLARFSAP
jgi:ligand-binding sensor domain-containing protein